MLPAKLTATTAYMVRYDGSEAGGRMLDSRIEFQR